MAFLVSSTPTFGGSAVHVPEYCAKRKMKNSVTWSLWKYLDSMVVFCFAHIFSHSHFCIEIGLIWCRLSQSSKILSSCSSSISRKYWTFTSPAAVCEMTSINTLEKQIKVHFHLETGQAKSILHRSCLLETWKLIACGFNLRNYTHSNMHLRLKRNLARVHSEICKCRF